MRKIILSVAITLDGYIEGPNGEYDWCFTDQDYGFTEFFSNVDTILYGRKSYELFGGYTPANDASGIEIEMFEKMLKMKKYVFSTTLKSAEGAEIISKNIKEEVAKIKEQPGKEIYLFGGASLVTSFVNMNLIDEYLLGLHPIILGAGKPLFSDINEQKKLKLAESKVYSTGLVMLKYQS